MRIRNTLIAAVTTVAILTGALGVASASDPGQNTAALPDVCRERPQDKARIATAKLIIEYNATNNDIGVHGAFDDHGWSELCVFDPNGKPIAVFDPQSQLNDLTMAGVFFESREPPGAEFSLADLAAAFPEGWYKVRAKSYDGSVLVGSAKFTHDVPAPPTITAPGLGADPEQPLTPVRRENLAVAWDRVTQTVTGEPVRITGYQVIVTKENHNDPHGFSRPMYDVHVPASVTSLSVPPEFLQADTLYEVEVLALERSGNQTIGLGFFVTD